MKQEEKELEAIQSVEIDSKRETIHFPWAMAIIMGVLMLAIIFCFVMILILEH